MSNYEPVSKKLSSGELVLLDGGIGTEIVKRGARWRWHGLKTDPEIVESVHRDYVSSGADVIKTDTFQLTKRLYLNVFHDLEHMKRIGAPDLETRARDLTRVAVDLARKAAANGSGRTVAIAGSIATIQHCFRPDLAPCYEEALPEHRETAGLLAECGVDLLLLESMNTVEEAAAAAQAAKETGLPFWVSFIPDEDGNLLSGEKIEDAVERVAPIGPDAFLINCGPPDDIMLALRALNHATELPKGAYAHIGFFDPPSWKFEFHPQFTGMEKWRPQEYVRVAEEWKEWGAQIIGGCCGTSPEHISALQSLRG
jgi:S-methylmethionine-dependent homocysteine/selenocysteine methylase